MKDEAFPRVVFHRFSKADIEEERSIEDHIDGLIKGIKRREWGTSECLRLLDLRNLQVQREICDSPTVAFAEMYA